MQPVRFVLVGVGMSMALSGAMIVMISSADRVKVDFIARWLAGDIWGTDWPFVMALFPWLIVLVPFTLLKANRLNILGLGEPVAIGVGLSVQRERIVLTLAAVALAASSVSVTGGSHHRLDGTTYRTNPYRIPASVIPPTLLASRWLVITNSGYDWAKHR